MRINDTVTVAFHFFSLFFLLFLGLLFEINIYSAVDRVVML